MPRILRSTSRLHLGALCLCSMVLRSATSWSQPVPTADLTLLLECKADVATYLTFRRWISRGGPDVARAGFAWRKTYRFEAEYGLSRTVSVFGLQARVFGLTGDGILAEVGGVTPQRLAQRLGIDPLLSTPTTFVANKLVAANDAAKAHAGEVQVAPTDLDALLGNGRAKPADDAQEVIQVITNQGQPGKTMVGCNYISSAESPNLPFPIK